MVRATLLLAGLSFVASSSARAADLTRGPVLQLAGATELTIVFRTDVPALGEVRFGVAGGSLERRETELVPAQEHVVHLTGLTPSTRYAYEVWVDGAVRAGGPEFTFRTYPPVGTAQPFRLFAWGDSGTANVNQLAVAERLARQADEATLSLILGDIIYDQGDAALYDARFFEPYARLTRRMVVWSTIGNHDVALDPTGGPYLDAFHLPTNNPAQSELYYSFDYGDAHFVCLDTHVSGHGPGAAQLTWAAADLAASSAKWKFVFFHVPPYSGGNHPDDPGIIANVLPVLEAAGVDVVFCGHSHAYERTYLLSNSAIVQADRSEYQKPLPDAGTLYLVSGSGGQTGPLSNPAHPLMAFQAGSVLGSLLVDVDGDQLRGTYLLADGSTLDGFRLQKGSDVTPPRVLTVREVSGDELEVVFDEPVARESVEAPRQWALRSGVQVLGAALLPGLRTVRLRTTRRPDGDDVVSVTGVADVNPAPNVGDASAAFVSHRRVLLTPQGPAKVLGGAQPASGWQAPGADETGWSDGALPLGFGVPGLESEVSPSTTVFARVPFVLPVAPGDLVQLELDVDFNDGFVASVDGVEVARQNVPWSQDAMTPASGRRERGLVQHLVLPLPPAALRAGENVLGLEVHNVDGVAGDAYVSARLTGVLAPGVDAGGAVVVDPPDAGPPPLDAGGGDGPFDPPRPDVDHGARSTLTGLGCGCSGSGAAWSAWLLCASLLRRRARQVPAATSASASASRS